MTVGNEIVSGDVENTNASWLSRRLAELGVEVRALAAVRDDYDEIGEVLRAESPRVTWIFLTGGLGGTPDDITREAVARAFGVPTVEIPDLAADLRSQFAPKGLSDYAARWARLPEGALPIDNPLGGAPGFVHENVVVMPGLPSEMEAMFDSIAPRFQGEPIVTWRRNYKTGEGQIVLVLEEATRRHPNVSIGSYPRFLETGPEVEVVLKSTSRSALTEARTWVETELEVVVSRVRRPGRP